MAEGPMTDSICITIPTFNRPELLLETIQALVPQLTEGCKILVIDNASDVSIKDFLAGVPGLNGIPLEVIRNRHNIGANANIARCFELANADWMWLLSDDDVVSENAITNIRTAIFNSPDSIYFNFAFGETGRLQTIRTLGLEEFLVAVDRWGDLNLISTNVYRVESMQKQLAQCYRFGYCCASHLVVILLALRDSGIACLEKDSVVNSNRDHNNINAWSWLPFALSRMTILDLPLSSKERKLLAGKILESKWILWHIVSILIADAYVYNRQPESLYLFDQIASRYFYFAPLRVRLILLPALRLVLLFPTVGYFFLSFLRSKDYLQRLVRTNKLDQM
jgi:abequosyltransferase